MRNEFNTAREILEDTISESPDKALKKKADKTAFKRFVQLEKGCISIYEHVLFVMHVMEEALG